MTEPASPPGAPYRAAEPPRRVAARSRATRVNLPRGPIAMPGVCACCLAPPQGSAFQSIPYGAWPSFRNVDFEVPYCAACLGHHAMARRRRVLSGLLAASIGAVAPAFFSAHWPYVMRMVIAGSGVLVALAVLLVLRAWFALRPLPLRRECVRADQAVRPVGATAFDVDLQVDNPAFAQRMQEEHARRASSTTDTHVEAAWTDHDDAEPESGSRAPARRSRRPARVSRMPWRNAMHMFWLVGPVAGLLGGYVVIRANYGRVYFDNPSTASLEFRIEDGPAVSVPPRAFGSAWVPTGEREVTVTSEGRAVDHIAGTVASGESYVYAPGEGACYARVTERLWSDADAPGLAAPNALRRRWVNVPAVDYVLEPFPFSTAYRADERPTVTTRFARVRCGTNVPDEE